MLQRPGRQRKWSSAKSLRASRTSSPSSPPCCNARFGRGWRRGERIVRHLPRRMRSDGLETVNVRTSRGTTVPLHAVLPTPVGRSGGREHLRPVHAEASSDASRAAMHSSLAEAQAQLRSDALDIKIDRYAARARAAQQSAACGLLDRVTGKRVVVSLDGGRVRVRRKKRGPKTKKGRNRFHTDWKEPKLLIRTSSATTGDRLRRGPRSSTARSGDRRRSSPCCCRTRGRSASTPLTRCSSSPTARPGRLQRPSPRSGSRRHRCWGDRLLSNSRGAGARPNAPAVCSSEPRGRGDHGPAGACRGRTAGKHYFLKNRHRFAYTTMVGLGLRGAAAPSKAPSVASSIRIKGASIYWLPESVDAILLLRSFYNRLQHGHDAGGCRPGNREAPLRTLQQPASIVHSVRVSQRKERALDIHGSDNVIASRPQPQPIVAHQDLAEDPRRPATSEGRALVLLMTRSATAFPSAEGSFDSNRRRSVSFGKTRAWYSSNDRIVPSSPDSVLRLSAISVASSDRSSC